MAATPADTPPIDRLTEIRQIWKDNHWLYGLVGFLLGALAFPLFNRLIGDALTLLGDLVPEAVGIVFTVVIIDRLYQRREEARKIEELKARLLREARSSVNDVAVQAINEIREHGWLTGEDGLLQNANLMFAELQGANLSGANLQNVNLSHAKLQTANLAHANLKFASLLDTNLQDCILDNANLRLSWAMSVHLENAYLANAQLQGAYLENAKLQGVHLGFANLADTNLNKAEFDENTTLPDVDKWSTKMIEEEMTRRFGCVFIDQRDEKNWEAWMANREKHAAGETDEAG